MRLFAFAAECNAGRAGLFVRRLARGEAARGRECPARQRRYCRVLARTSLPVAEISPSQQMGSVLRWARLRNDFAPLVASTRCRYVDCLETFGADSIVDRESPVVEAFLAEASIASG